MKARLAIALGMIGLLLSCTLFTAQAVEYRKDKTEVVKSIEFDFAPTVVVEAPKFHAYDVAFVVPSNCFEIVLPISFAHLKDDDKPDNRYINGILNERRISKSLVKKS